MWGFGGLGARGRGRRAVRGLAGGDGPGRRRDARARDAHDRGTVMIKRLGRWFDDRLGASRFAAHVARTRSSRTTGRSCWAKSRCTASSSSSSPASTSRSSSSRATRPVVYTAATDRCAATTMSQAYESTVRLSFDVRAGLVMRQIHHWAALLFIATIVAHLCRIFFTGAFRRPRELNWIIGVTLLVLAIFNGFAGYSLPDDLLSGTGLRIAYSIALAIPIVGTWLAFLVFGGEFPASDILTRLFVIHILHHPGRDRDAARRAPRDPVAAEAHAVPRARPARGQRRRVAAVADLHGEEHRPVRGRRRRARAARRSRADQPGVALRSVRPVRGEHRRAARLVHGLDRGRAAARAARRTCRSVRTTSPSCSGPRSRCRASRSGCCTCGRSSSGASRTTPPSTTCSIGRATARCAPRSVSACSRSTSVLLLAGAPGHLGAEARRRPRRRSCGRSASCCSPCRCCSAGSPGRCAATCRPATTPSTRATSPSCRSRRTRRWHRAGRPDRARGHRPA